MYKELWKSFEKSGDVKAYLKYRSAINVVNDRENDKELAKENTNTLKGGIEIGSFTSRGDCYPGD